MKVILAIFEVIVKFQYNLNGGVWIVDEGSGELIHASFIELKDLHEKFKEYCKFLFLGKYGMICSRE